MRSNETFTSNGITIAAHLYLPETLGSEPTAAIVVGHPASGVKEQTAGAYAQQLADAGFIALTWDAAYQGESGGLPRGLEDPAQRVEDFKNAVSFLTTRPEVDIDRIGALGICASGGYVIPAAVTDHRIRAVATVSAVDTGLSNRVGADGTQDPAVIQSVLDIAASARTAEAAGEPMQMLPIFPATEEEARAGGQHVFDGWEYYCTDRGQHPRSAKEFTATSIDRIVNFNAFHLIDLLHRPLLMVVGSAAVTAWQSTQAFSRALEPKRFVEIDGATHVDLYDRRVPEVASELVPFFTANLAASNADAVAA